MIMIVDDSARMRTMIANYVQDISIDSDLCECGDGSEAIHSYGNIRPDWVLMDVKMPKMDGLSATRAILADHPDARIIIVSNFDDPELRAEAARIGAMGYVLKERLFELRELMR